MDVFEFRERLVREYGQFTRSFTRIRSEDIARFVTTAYESQRYWPAPLRSRIPPGRQGLVTRLADGVAGNMPFDRRADGDCVGGAAEGYRRHPAVDVP